MSLTPLVTRFPSWKPLFKAISGQACQRSPIHEAFNGLRFDLANVYENHEAQNNSLLERAA